MSLKLENTEKYLRQYTKSLLDNVVVEISRTDRTREYNQGTITSPIKASGSLQESLRIVEKDNKSVLELNIEGNAYGEQIDEGTKSTSVPSSTKYWMPCSASSKLESRKPKSSNTGIKFPAWKSAFRIFSVTWQSLVVQV